MTYYYEVIDNTVSINLLSSINEKIIKADKYFSHLKIDSEKHIKFIKEQNNFKYKKEIIDLYHKEINEIPHWDDFKKLLYEIKNQINLLD